MVLICNKKISSLTLWIQSAYAGLKCGTDYVQLFLMHERVSEGADCYACDMDVI